MLSLRCQSYTTFTQSNEIELDDNINPNLGVEAGPQCNIYIFQSTEEMSQNLTKLCYGDLYVIGSLWIEGMKKIMIGKKMCVVPKINAATNNNIITANQQGVHKPHITSEADSIPKKPSDMRYTDLPIYCSPHRDYNEYLYSTWYRPECNSQTLQRIIYPYVRQARMNIQSKLKEGRQHISETLCVLRCITATRICKVREHLRDPSNRVKAKTCVALSTATGVVLGSRKGLLRAIFYGGLGALASGSLCFPRETDMAFRRACHTTWSLVRGGYNIFEGKHNCENGKYPCPNRIPRCPEEDIFCEAKSADCNKARKDEKKCRSHF